MNHWKMSQLPVATVGSALVLFLVAADATAGGDHLRGQKAFQRASCAGCHPGGGNVLNPQAPLKGEKFATEFATDAKIIEVVRQGKKGTAMPAFDKKRVSNQELQDIIVYIRSLTPKPAK